MTKTTKPRTQQVKESIESMTKEDYDKLKRYAFCVYASFICSDLCESYILEADKFLQPLNAGIDGDIKNSVHRIAIHARNLVGYADKYLPKDMAIDFGDTSDEIRNFIETIIKIEK